MNISILTDNFAKINRVIAPLYKQKKYLCFAKSLIQETLCFKQTI
jgi:hypothetical protein